MSLPPVATGVVVGTTRQPRVPAGAGGEAAKGTAAGGGGRGGAAAGLRAPCAGATAGAATAAYSFMLTTAGRRLYEPNLVCT